MRTVTIDYDLFQVQELSQKAQRTAHQNWLINKEYFHSEENRKTLLEFEKLFDIRVRGWNYDSCNYNYRFETTLSGDIEELRGVRLAIYITNNHWFKLFQYKKYWKGKTKRKSRVMFDADCTLTGYCADHSILEPIYDFLKTPNKEITYLKLMDTCLDTFFRFCKDDVVYSDSEEYFNEESNANELEYLANGKLFN